MDDAKPKRPWWRRKRWRVAVVLLMAWPALYPVAFGPAIYSWRRGWLPDGRFGSPYRWPLARSGYVMREYGVLDLWTMWWRDLADGHGRAAGDDR